MQFAGKFMTAVLCAAAWGAAGSAGAQEIYVKGGWLGAGAGVAYGVNDHLGLRADVSTIGSLDRDRTSKNLRYNAEIKANQVGAYADWFPFTGGFRLSAGLNVRQLQAEGNGIAQNGTITINNTKVPYGPGDNLRATVKFPSVAPYVGLGWGHAPAATAKGWGFVFDAGVSIGKPRTSVDLSPSLYAKLDLAAQASGSSADAEIAQQRAKIADDADKLRFFPQLYVGVSYKF